VTIVAMGWPAEEPAAPERLPLSEILHWEHW
jgi:nitroreductase